MKTKADMVGWRGVCATEAWDTEEARARGLESKVKAGKEDSKLLKMPMGRMIRGEQCSGVQGHHQARHTL